MDKSKPFGLIISKRAKAYRPTVSTVFGSDSDDEPSAKKKKMPSIPQAKPKKQLQPEMSEDPSIYEYDSIYDDMKAQEVAKVAPKDASKPSRYVESLLKAADKRKKDQERRVEKKVHHERELEGDKFSDKEAFVTSAYKKKMQEMEEEEERERRENMLNEMMDVTKQKDLSGFYRHFLKQSIGEENVPVFGERYAKKEDGIKQEKNSDEDASGVDVCRGIDVGSARANKSKKEKGKSFGNIDQDTNSPGVVKQERMDIEDSTSGDVLKGSARAKTPQKRTGKSLKGTDKGMDSSCDENSTRDKVVQRSKCTIKQSSEKDVIGGNMHKDTDIATEQNKAKLLDGDIDQDTDMGSSSDEDIAAGKVVQQTKDAGIGKSPKKNVCITEKEKSLLDDNIDQDTDMDSSNDEEALDDKGIQGSKENVVKISPSKVVLTKKVKSSFVEKDLHISSIEEVESDKVACGSSSKPVVREQPPHKDFPRKRSENSGKLKRNIRKRAEDVDSSSSDELPSTSDDENGEEPKANGVSEEEPSILETSEKLDEAQQQKPKVDIFAKRTVGDVFADAQVRYFQRMAARST